VICTLLQGEQREWYPALSTPQMRVEGWAKKWAKPAGIIGSRNIFKRQ
jgi:hypothetical protein